MGPFSIVSVSVQFGTGYHWETYAVVGEEDALDGGALWQSKCVFILTDLIALDVLDRVE